MTVILASLALFVAFVGLWLANANTKKIDAGNEPKSLTPLGEPGPAPQLMGAGAGPASGKEG